MSLPTARRRDGRRGRRWSPQRAGRAACRAPGAPAAPSPRTHLQPRRRSPRPGHLFLSGGSDLDPGLARSNWQAASETRRTALLFRGDDAAEMAFFFLSFWAPLPFGAGWGGGEMHPAGGGGGWTRGGSSGGGPRARARLSPGAAVLRTLSGGARVTWAR